MHAETSFNMNVGDICRRDVTTVTAHTALVDAARLLCDSHVQGVVAIASRVSRPTAIGVVTDRDILRAMLDRDGDLSGMNVVDILSRQPFVLNEDERIQDAMAKLQSRGVEYAPVVGPGGILCGAISQRDLLAGLLKHLRSEPVPAAHPASGSHNQLALDSSVQLRIAPDPAGVQDQLLHSHGEDHEHADSGHDDSRGTGHLHRRDG